MTRRTLLKLVALLPWAGPVIVKALAKSQVPPGPAYSPFLPAEFPKWNPAVDGLSDAGEWVLDLERSRLPRDIIFPRVGQIWAAVRDCQVEYRISIEQPEPAADLAKLLQDFARQFGVAQLSQGERVRILEVDHPDKPLRVTFQPLRYLELQAGIVPEDTRQSPGYSGYELSMRTARTISCFGKEPCQTYFNEAFRAVCPPPPAVSAPP